MNTMSHQNLWT